ncbi:putative Rossmann fold flavoprotein [Kroppenstedtia sanguinis]|uniref:NAD(P)/FAD-dependent oxidoreductase n=1 Tax=Kroppenstedtia sanguinis TaxID=1380684 RepID=UPI003D1A5385
MTWDVIVIGGGPAGLMASVAAAEQGAQVLLLDKGDKPGRKLAISGGGRCNVTNNGESGDIIRHIPGNGKFLYSPFATFNNQDIIHFFEKLGVKLKEEDHGRMFPVSDSAQSVVEALLRRIRELGTTISLRTPVSELLFSSDRVTGLRLENGETLQASCVVVAVGGKSVPHTGSTGDGYPWAKAAGHHITELFPTEVPLTSEEIFIRERTWQGLSLRGVRLSVIHPKGKKLTEHTGDLLFTHFGLSGPIALRCSQFVVKTLKQEAVDHVKLELDWFPNEQREKLQTRIQEEWKKNPKKAVKTILKPHLPDRAIPLLLQRSGLHPEVTWNHVSKADWEKLFQLLKSFPLQIHGTLPIEKAFVTGGGVHLKEIHPKTMESKLKQGLYFAGEILDIHGYTGGYNITAAFSTGFTAGKHAALQSLERVK